jgi:putative (di)nucleoside polyphosphate hydrolase
MRQGDGSGELFGPHRRNVKKSGRSGAYAHMTDLIDAQGFRANVGIVLIRDGGDVFLGGRSDGRGWQFPQGGVLEHESAEQALYRELREEVGLEPADVEVIAATRNWLRYRLPRRYVRRRSQPLCIGQKQRWFLLRMLGSEERLRFDLTTQPEFDSWRWVDYWSPVREVIYFKRVVYARALEELGRQAFPDGPPPRPDWWTEAVLRPPRKAGTNRAALRPAAQTAD